MAALHQGSDNKCAQIMYARVAAFDKSIILWRLEAIMELWGEF